jgi:hypothetical protein
MNVALLVLGALLATAVKPPPMLTLRQPGLASYEGVQINKLPVAKRKQFDAIYKPVRPPVGDSSWWVPEPWRLSAWNVEGASWAVIEVAQSMSHPGADVIRPVLFDHNWKVVGKWRFAPGYRIYISELKIVRKDPISQPLLSVYLASGGPFVIEEGKPAKPLFHPDDGIREYYTLSPSGVRLIRLERGNGDLIPNSYTWEKPAIGPDVTGRSAASWLSRLQSKAPEKQLEALVWLSGTHLSSKHAREQNVSRETRKDSLTYEALKKSKALLAHLAELTHSSNRWVREYARFTQTQFKNPPIDD